MIELQNITKIYKTGEVETIALKNINLKINKGDFVSIMGPSGSGKSTLMHIIGLLDKPTGGTYILDGQDISKLNDDELAKLRNKKIGFVFQAFFLLPRKNVLENVILPSIYSDLAPFLRKERAIESLKASAFPMDFIYHYPNQLSGGMMQRVAIARALINDPEIILADEPTGNLDTKTGEIVLHTFQKLNIEKGITIVLITHEEYVAEHAEKIIRIRDGEIINEEEVENRKILYHNNENN
ncbi:MAG: macrolide export ATP-binding/permease protein MacB [Candidatus Parcubacteria bacterium]|nr:MAG: macrolide export ATP-binding/permease protein MacB [Candidatus Parcubacteria bacterium]